MLPCTRVIGLVMVMSLSWGTLDACCGSKGHVESLGAPGVLGSRHSPGWGLRSILGLPEAPGHPRGSSPGVVFADIWAQEVREALFLPSFADRALGLWQSATVLQSLLAALPSPHLPPPRSHLSVPQGRLAWQ